MVIKIWAFTFDTVMHLCITHRQNNVTIYYYWCVTISIFIKLWFFSQIAFFEFTCTCFETHSYNDFSELAVFILDLFVKAAKWAQVPMDLFYCYKLGKLSSQRQWYHVFTFRKSQDSQKELKLLLDMYKSVPKESRDRVQVRYLSL